MEPCLIYDCGCQILMDDSHCCDARIVNFCEFHEKIIEARYAADFKIHARWCKENPDMAMKLAMAYMNAMADGAEGLIVRDIIPDKHTTSKVTSRDWRQPSEPK